MFSRTTQAILAVLLLAGAAQASLHCSETSLRVLQSYGSGQATLSCTLSTKPNERYLSANLQGYRRKIITSISFSPVSGSSVLNITAHLDLDGKLGYTAFKLAVQTTQRVLYTPASCDVRGVQAHVPVLRRWRPIPPSARVVLYSGRGEAPARLSDCKLSSTNKQLVVTATNNNRLIVRGDRRAPREAKVLIDCPAISLDGETAETDLRMRVRRARNRGALRIAARSARIRSNGRRPVCVLLLGANAKAHDYGFSANGVSGLFYQKMRLGRLLRACFKLSKPIPHGTYDYAVTFKGRKIASSSPTKLVVA